MSTDVTEVATTSGRAVALVRSAALVRRVVVVVALVSAVGLAALDAFDQEYGAGSGLARCAPGCLDLVPARDAPPQSR